MRHNQFLFKSTIWLYPGKSGWHFASIPKDVSEEIRERFFDFKRGWGSFPVLVTIGSTKWSTSIFPDSKEKIYLLPIKSEIRKKEILSQGDKIELFLEIKDI